MITKLIKQVNETALTVDLSDCNIYDYSDYSADAEISEGDLVGHGLQTAFVYAIGGETVTFQTQSGSLIEIDMATAEDVQLVARFNFSQNYQKLMSVALAVAV